MTTADGAPRFPSDFDQDFSFLGTGKGYFGTDVLRGLVQGIDEFATDPEKRWEQYRSLGPALLGCVPWLDDPDLIDRILTFPSSCVVITKPELKKRDRESFQEFKRKAEQGPGFPAEAFGELTGLDYHVDGRPPMIGPYSPRPQVVIPSIRSFGFRKTGSRPVPLLHAKVFLLGHLWWHDEDDTPTGVADVIGFAPKRLWLSSANGTRSSRLGVEFGVWLEDPDLLAAARRFLVQVMRSSENVDPDADLFVPELVDPEYDNEAFWQVWAEEYED